MSSNFKDLYKRSMDSAEQQRKRQRELLKEHKLRRQQERDENRVMPVQSCKKSKQKQRANYRGRTRDELQYRPQLSEWLRHRPEELGDWLLVPCPIGKRYLVVANNGKTKVYNKGGRQIMQIQTMLPGDGQQHKCTTILDCVYVEDMDIFYVLDAISFGQQDLQECEANFRFYWLRARFDEYPVDLGQCRDGHEKAFVLLKHYDFEDASAVEEVLQKYPIWEENKPQLDGFLFYHKQASYVCGTTPLVCWLFAYMLPNLLGLPVNGNYVAPEDYLPDQALDYMDEFDRKLKEQRKKPIQKREMTNKPTEMDQEPAHAVEEESDEDASLRNLLNHQRLLELGELDMDCSEPSLVSPPPPPHAAAVSC
ncbi:uncharacterized protein Dwil_GK27411 [Drosophila willistoni]|uniref:Snurportin-1 n=1 Tax=Drosophila willistoni TaxID=7260 RepID=A0A0Q9WTT4_DROWI|nr:snurportin-1 [Drosophila willistoni]KRF98957.1 uncharacterized protein Dwil_GK27411 [Drosophila willistoni]